MDRLTFFNSIIGVRYPEMLIEFYDQFLALYYILANNYQCAISVVGSTDRSITFCIDCNNKIIIPYLINHNNIIIYGRSVSIYSENMSDNQLKITLQ